MQFLDFVTFWSTLGDRLDLPWEEVGQTDDLILDLAIDSFLLLEIQVILHEWRAELSEAELAPLTSARDLWDAYALRATRGN